MKTSIATPTNDFQSAYPLEEYRLLTASQECQLDRLKWTAARMALRMLLNNKGGRDTVAHFCNACINSPPRIENFTDRSLYFHLRRDIKEMIPAGSGVDSMQQLVHLLSVDTTTGTLIRAVNRASWPATVSVGIAYVHLCRLGEHSKDKMARAMLHWFGDLPDPPVSTSRTLPHNLRHVLGRYIFSRDQLVLHNIRLVHKLAKDQAGTGISPADLAQDGLIGLIRAAEKYDHRLGYRFSTYAYTWIKQQIQRANEGNGSLINYPVNVMKDVQSLYKAREKFFQAHGVKPGLEQLQCLSGFSSEKIAQLSQHNNLTVSLEHRPKEFDDEGIGLDEKIPGETSYETSDQAEKVILSELVEASLGCLEAREQYVVKARWGLSGSEPASFKDIAAELQVSHEWARQLEHSALTKLSQHDGLKDYFLHDD